MRENIAVAVDGFIRKLGDQRHGQFLAVRFRDLHRDAVHYRESGFERMRAEQFQLPGIEFHQPGHVAGQPGRDALDQPARAFAPAGVVAQHQEEAFRDGPQLEMARQVA